MLDGSETIDDRPLLRVRSTDALSACRSRRQLIQPAQRYSFVPLKTFAPDPPFARLSVGVAEQDLCQDRTLPFCVKTRAT